MLGPTDMDYILDHAEVRFALIDDNLHAQPEFLGRAALQKRGIDLVAVDLAARPRRRALRISTDPCQSEVEPDIDFNDRDLAMIIYTSGTTFAPEGAMHCHLAVVMAVMSNAIEMHLDRNDRVTGQFPLFHCRSRDVAEPSSVGGLAFDARGFDPVACKPSWRQAHGLCRPAADVSGHPRSPAPPDTTSGLTTCL